MKQKYLILFSLSGLIICLDQLTKFLSHSRLVEGTESNGLGSWLVFTQIRNNGFAFRMLEKLPASIQDVFFIAVPVFALVLIILIFIKLQDNQMLTGVALTTILAGALGNMVDRIQHGYVVDVVRFQLGAYRSAPFNIADISIVVGVILMIFNTLIQHRQERASL